MHLWVLNYANMKTCPQSRLLTFLKLQKELRLFAVVGQYSVVFVELPNFSLCKCQQCAHMT